MIYNLADKGKVSTHSHPKVAARNFSVGRTSSSVSTHSHPKVAASAFSKKLNSLSFVSTHSHPKVAAQS